ncbi:tryptophan synthase subunit alpha [Streptomyces sp. TR02-1]|uniref:tryptophan synthase subunit alpha n=1 Tax=Streptomyces sp. TR02-1 TaxID=3385977 RepID=UPI0039A30B79
MNPSPSPAARLDAVFTTARTEHRPVLIGCLPAGYPTPTASYTALRLVARHVDILEIALPAPVPVLDGPDMAHAAATALDAGTTPATTMNLIRALTHATDTPITLMSYWDPISRHGPDAMAAALAAAGAAGAVLPDIHPHGRAATNWRAAATTHRLHSTFLAGEDQLAAAALTSTGWVYLPATCGPTGTHTGINLPYLRRRLAQIPNRTSLPVCAGIGISSPQQAAAVARSGADGVIIGSALLRALTHAATQNQGLEQLDRCVARYAQALRRGAGAAGSLEAA